MGLGMGWNLLLTLFFFVAFFALMFVLVLVFGTWHLNGFECK
jgi:hypothetical protein